MTVSMHVYARRVCSARIQRILLLLGALIGLVAVAAPGFSQDFDPSPVESATEAAGGPQPGDSAGLDREDRLNLALRQYAQALTESDRDSRLAGFARAERSFESLAADGVETAALFTNLGNAALQAQHPGEAVLAYHRALRLAPEATTARQNLDHLRTRLPSWVPRPDSSPGGQAFLALTEISEATRSLVAAACFVLMSGSVVLAVRRREGAWRGLAILMGFLWVTSVGSIAYDRMTDEDHLAVVVADEVPARSADSLLAPLALPDPLPSGVEVLLLEERAEWSRVRLANGRDVWVRSSSVERVSG
jgi:hypothetical protein